MSKKIILIGTKTCSRCSMTKSLLEKNGVAYEYQILDELSNKEQKEILEKAKNKGVISLPIILSDDVVVSDFREVL